MVFIWKGRSKWRGTICSQCSKLLMLSRKVMCLFKEVLLNEDFDFRCVFEQRIFCWWGELQFQPVTDWAGRSGGMTCFRMLILPSYLCQIKLGRDCKNVFFLSDTELVCSSKLGLFLLNDLCARGYEFHKVIFQGNGKCYQHLISWSFITFRLIEKM